MERDLMSIEEEKNVNLKFEQQYVRNAIDELKRAENAYIDTMDIMHKDTYTGREGIPIDCMLQCRLLLKEMNEEIHYELKKLVVDYTEFCLMERLNKDLALSIDDAKAIKNGFLDDNQDLLNILGEDFLTSAVAEVVGAYIPKEGGAGTADAGTIGDGSVDGDEGNKDYGDAEGVGIGNGENVGGNGSGSDDSEQTVPINTVIPTESSRRNIFGTIFDAGFSADRRGNRNYSFKDEAEDGHYSYKAVKGFNNTPGTDPRKGKGIKLVYDLEGIDNSKVYKKKTKDGEISTKAYGFQVDPNTNVITIDFAAHDKTVSAGLTNSSVAKHINANAMVISTLTTGSCMDKTTLQNDYSDSIDRIASDVVTYIDHVKSLNDSFDDDDYLIVVSSASGGGAAEALVMARAVELYEEKHKNDEEPTEMCGAFLRIDYENAAATNETATEQSRINDNLERDQILDHALSESRIPYDTLKITGANDGSGITKNITEGSKKVAAIEAQNGNAVWLTVDGGHSASAYNLSFEYDMIYNIADSLIDGSFDNTYTATGGTIEKPPVNGSTGASVIVNRNN